MDFEKVGGHNAAVRGYILRMLVKGYHNTLGRPPRFQLPCPGRAGF